MDIFIKLIIGVIVVCTMMIYFTIKTYRRQSKQRKLDFVRERAGIEMNYVYSRLHERLKDHKAGSPMDQELEDLFVRSFELDWKVMYPERFINEQL